MPIFELVPFNCPLQYLLLCENILVMPCHRGFIFSVYEPNILEEYRN